METINVGKMLGSKITKVSITKENSDYIIIYEGNDGNALRLVLPQEAWDEMIDTWLTNVDDLEDFEEDDWEEMFGD